jgi:ABC-type lipoprotein release transport system permease subunit
MGNKIVLSLLAVGSVLTIVAVVTVMAVMQFAPVQAEEATVDSVPVLEIEPVSQQVEKPVISYDRVKYAGKSGGCGYESASQLMVEAPVQKVDVDDSLLTLAETE